MLDLKSLRKKRNSFIHSTISDEEKINWIRLSRSENVGKTTFFRLMSLFGSAKKSLEQISNCASNGGLKRKIRIASQSQVEKEIIKTEKFGAQILLFSDEKYPRLLREIYDPPPIITIKGDLDFVRRDTVAIVGPRNASFNGLAFAKKIALELSQNSVITVSGMARGVDTAAHEASILGGTIAVIAGGIDHIYPKSNEALYNRIAKHGLLISESPFGAPPKGGNFVQRNRIISGLSLATIIVEAGLKSGSLTTARFAGEQGREVFAVPGSPFDDRCSGSNRLIKDGVNMIENIDDILGEIPSIRARFSEVGKICEPQIAEFAHFEERPLSDDDVKKVREEIMLRLSFSPIEIEEIINDFNLPSRLVNIAIIELELAEQIEVNHGKISLKITF